MLNYRRVSEIYSRILILYQAVLGRQRDRETERETQRERECERGRKTEREKERASQTPHRKQPHLINR